MNELDHEDSIKIQVQNSAVPSPNVPVPINQEESKVTIVSEPVETSDQQKEQSSNGQNLSLNDSQNDTLVKCENEGVSNIDEHGSLPESPVLHAGITLLPNRDNVLVSIGTHIEGAPVVGPVQTTLESFSEMINKMRADYGPLFQKFRLSEMEKRKSEIVFKTIQNKNPKVKDKVNTKNGVHAVPTPADKAVQFSDYQQPVGTPVIQGSFQF